ncbi:hypothetical protein [uncultured Psychromonas sp.]|uniref:hypothetical protein n=1 Tax=uncultured Psychromonas sp. TaxID=173974 RepID=UPI0026046102|nr:hypothetical protein [uncultured Psychromonas sp.]
MNFDEDFFVKSARKHAEKSIELSKWGWYPTPNIKIGENLRKLQEQDLINTFYSKRNRECLNENELYCLENAQERKRVLKAAFRLHHAGEYYGSIPIFLAQAEGIFNEEFKRSIFSNSSRSYEKINKIRQFNEGIFFDAFLSSTFVSNQIGDDKSKCSDTLKQKGPNRNGIMHGDVRHTDYGSETNSLKSISLLCCAIWLSAVNAET